MCAACVAFITSRTRGPSPKCLVLLQNKLSVPDSGSCRTQIPGGPRAQDSSPLASCLRLMGFLQQLTPSSQGQGTQVRTWGCSRCKFSPPIHARAPTQPQVPLPVLAADPDPLGGSGTRAHFCGGQMGGEENQESTKNTAVVFGTEGRGFCVCFALLSGADGYGFQNDPDSLFLICTTGTVMLQKKGGLGLGGHMFAWCAGHSRPSAKGSCWCCYDRRE